MQISGLNNNNSAQRIKLDELNNEVAILEEAIQMQKKHVAKAEERCEQMQKKMAEQVVAKLNRSDSNGDDIG